MIIAQSIVLAFEAEALWRGANSRRFLHLTESVEYSIVPFNFEEHDQGQLSKEQHARVTRFFGIKYK